LCFCRSFSFFENILILIFGILKKIFKVRIKILIITKKETDTLRFHSLKEIFQLRTESKK